MPPTARRGRTRRILYAVTALALAAAGTTAAMAEDDVPRDDPDRGIVHSGLVQADSGPCAGMFSISTTGSCTHGPDPAPPGYDTKKRVPPLTGAMSALAAPCVGDGQSGKRVQMMYVHPAGTDRFAQYKASFERWTSDMDVIYNASAAETGGTRHIRLVHDSACVPSVLNVTVSSAAMADFGTMIRELKAKGYTRTDRKYGVFGESNKYCGIGEFPGDARKIPENRANSGPHFARTDTGCWGGTVLAHELGHNLGAVLNSAPNASGGAHCTDEWDVMCYSDSPYYPPMRYICTDRGHDLRLDCGHNDYYHTNPPAGSFLANNYNMADNAFLTGGGSPGRTGPVRSGLAGKCLDANGNGSADGTKVQTWTCHGGAAQTWTYTSAQTLTINGKCLDVTGAATANGTTVALWSCTGGSNQRWTSQSDGTLRSAHSGRCLDVPGASTADGVGVVIWDCNGGANQRWSLP